MEGLESEIRGASVDHAVCEVSAYLCGLKKK